MLLSKQKQLFSSHSCKPVTVRTHVHGNTILTKRSIPMDKYMYPSLKARIQAEYKIYLLAFLFIAIADKIGQIKIPFGLGTFILFPIF